MSEIETDLRQNLAAITAEATALHIQRDELLEALEKLADSYQWYMDFKYGDNTEVEEVDTARAIIAEVKERRMNKYKGNESSRCDLLKPPTDKALSAVIERAVSWVDNNAQPLCGGTFSHQDYDELRAMLKGKDK